MSNGRVVGHGMAGTAMAMLVFQVYACANCKLSIVGVVAYYNLVMVKH